MSESELHPYLKALSERVLIYDGAMGTNIQLHHPTPEEFATPDRPRFVAGSIGPTGMLPSSSDPVLSNITFAALAENYYAQAKYLVEGGVDVLLVETGQ